MPLPSVTDVCIELDPATGLDAGLGISLDFDLSALSILFPGGVLFSAQGAPKIPNPGDLTGKFLGEINAALMPLMPLFDLIDTLLLIKGVLDAVVSLNPFKISAKISALLPKLDKLKGLLPQFSIPHLLKDIIAVLIVFLTGLRAQMQAIIDAQSKIDLSAARATALGSIDLQAAVSCAQTTLDVQFTAMKNNAAPLNRLIGVVNLLAGLVGLPEIPPLSLDVSSASEALVPIDTAIAALQIAYDAIPI